MSAVVVGIDPSLTATGLAWLDGHTATTTTIRTAGHRGDSITERHRRIAGITGDTARWLRDLRYATHQQPALYVIEGPSLGSRGGSAWDRAGLWWSIVTHLVTGNIARAPVVAIAPPTNRAKWATGNTKADKAAVAARIARLAPDAELRNSDEADALALALMGAHAHGLRDDLHTQYRWDALAACEWPPDLAARVLRPYEQPVDTQ